MNAYDRLMRLSENNSGDLREEEKIVLDNLDDIKKEFEKKMDDDLNTADAITCLFDITKEVNSNVDEDSSKELVDKSLNLFLELSDVLGFIYKKDEVLDDKIEELIENREKARANKNYALADEIRDELKEMGITLKDTRQGVVWTKE